MIVNIVPVVLVFRCQRKHTKAEKLRWQFSSVWSEFILLTRLYLNKWCNLTDWHMKGVTQHNYWCLHSGCTSARIGVRFRRTFVVWFFFVLFELKDTFCKPQLCHMNFTGALVWALCISVFAWMIFNWIFVSVLVSKKNLSNNTHNFPWSSYSAA